MDRFSTCHPLAVKRPVLWIDDESFNAETEAARLAERQRPERIGDIGERVLSDLFAVIAGPGRSVLHHRRDASVRQVRERCNRPRLPRGPRRARLAGGLAGPNRWGDAGGGDAAARPAGLGRPIPIRPEAADSGDGRQTAPPSLRTTRHIGLRRAICPGPIPDDPAIGGAAR